MWWRSAKVLSFSNVFTSFAGKYSGTRHNLNFLYSGTLGYLGLWWYAGLPGVTCWVTW